MHTPEFGPSFAEALVGDGGIILLARRDEAVDVDERDSGFLDDGSSTVRKGGGCEDDEWVFGLDGLMAIGEDQRAGEIIIFGNEGRVCTVDGAGGAGWCWLLREEVGKRRLGRGESGKRGESGERRKSGKQGGSKEI